MCRTENCLEQIINELLECSLGGQQSGEVDFGDQLVAPLVLLTVGVVTDEMPHLDPGVVVVVERGGGPGERRRVPPSHPATHLADVESLVLVVEVAVGLVAHGADVVHAALLRDEGQQGSVRDPVMVEGVDPLPVSLGLGGAVLVIEDQPPTGSRPPLQVEV